MNFLVSLATNLIGLMQKSGETFSGMIIDTIPMLIALLTGMNFIIKLIGEEKINKLAIAFGKNKILTYGFLPSIAWFFFSSPGGVALGRFLPEKCKPGYEDALGATAHPLTSLFPHTVPFELFVWLGIAEGVKKAGYSTTTLAVRYILAVMILGLVRGVLTEYIFVKISRRNEYNVDSL